MAVRALVGGDQDRHVLRTSLHLGNIMYVHGQLVTIVRKDALCSVCARARMPLKKDEREF